MYFSFYFFCQNQLPDHLVSIPNSVIIDKIKPNRKNSIQPIHKNRETKFGLTGLNMVIKIVIYKVFNLFLKQPIHRGN